MHILLERMHNAYHPAHLVVTGRPPTHNDAERQDRTRRGNTQGIT